MTKKGFYSSGEFAARAHVSLRTVRYYDRIGLLSPSAHSDAGARLYNDADLGRMQQILLYKYLGFSLDDIREMTMAGADQHFLLETMRVQQKLVQERIGQMQAVAEALSSTMSALQKGQEVDYDHMLALIDSDAMERSLKTQYQNAANITARIRLHSLYSTNPLGWFVWLYQQASIQDGMKILEIGCGNGALWQQNLSVLPPHVQIVLSDISAGMIHDVQNRFRNDARFSCMVFDAAHMPFDDNTFDLVIANHMLFYCDDLSQVLQECARVLKVNGHLEASTYSSRHMKEITELVQSFSPQIVLSKDKLYEKFGLDHGAQLLSPYFRDIERRKYQDSIVLHEAEPLIAYILSCHGNQNQLLLDRYKEFHDYVVKMTAGGFTITKDAGVFLAEKK
ncbi:MAG: MerR family transcriptional regulator [Erysipelotrichaceae bacterium]|jgi:ubiquinone/menaquinone biosynthesis C-methylase UbiE/DNA-binding transcriptional MerR regulator|nr:MerR family transcriptional regulator [Erysipelotrichaceae bacterium]MCI1325772.1 MerR family transcriptional regulator [Solobacterium sp.]MCH4043941.1 MerR family transcriptional regulator [Erysipelotrichaceae bacterium]MCH4121156.1 MerR family transcriptional regulator [Erysipelotrichaceae bacterium]MCI1362366.1 MerR family transcriptional regulator [Solobacterium sp.]